MRLVLFLLLLPVLLSGPSVAPCAAAATQPTAIERLVAEFEALGKDKARSGRRDLWIALEDKFAALRAKSKGDTAARAAFYRARTRQELAARSFQTSDQREAAKRFGAVADAYGKNALARESLYRQADILERRLGDHAAAIAVLERLTKAYPQSKEAADGKKLLAEARKNAAASPAKQDAGGKPAAGKNASSVILKKISWKGKPQRAVVTLELDADADFEHGFLPPDAKKKTPARLYLDIAGAFPDSKVKPGLSPKDLVVTRIKTGRHGEGTRVMLECDGVQCYAVRTPGASPRTIQIEISRKTDIADGISVAAGKSGGGSGKSGPKAPASVMEQLGLTVKTILLDPGHGGKDPGAQAAGIDEKRFTLAMAKRIGAVLQKKGFTVLYTRTGDQYISLQDRPDIANNKKADLFISIHVNANTTPGIHGLETYYLDEAKTQDAAVVAARENAVSVKNISDLQFILTDLMLGSKVRESHKLAECVQAGILTGLRRAKLPAHSNGVRSAPFYVLMGARMPAILVEFGYITNKTDAANLKSEAFLQRQAEGLVDGILKYKAELEKMAPS